MNNPETALNHLKELLNEQHESYAIKTIVSVLGNRALAVLLLLFSLPFAFPITIPGLSTPFGVLLFIVGFRFMRDKPLWLPKKITMKHISHKHLTNFVKVLEKFLRKMRHIIKPRLFFVFETPIITGIAIMIQSFFMALPIPLPLTNCFASIPIVLLALGLLASDGLFILLGYLSSLIAIAFFTALLWFGLGVFERFSPF